MAAKNLYQLCCAFMADYYFPCQWQVVYPEEEEQVVINLQFDLANPDRVRLCGPSDQQIDQEKVTYQLRALLTAQSFVDHASQYLFCYHFDERQGVPVGDLAALFKQLRHLVTSLQADWRCFIEDPQARQFGVEWSWQDFDQQVETLKDQGRYSRERVHLASANYRKLRKKR